MIEEVTFEVNQNVAPRNGKWIMLGVMKTEDISYTFNLILEW